MSFDKVIIDKLVSLIQAGDIPPWKIEGHLADEYGLFPPGNYYVAATVRRKFLEKISGEKFRYLLLPENPYLIKYQCKECNIDYQLAAFDGCMTCSVCGNKLISPKPQQLYSLTANYIGGIDDYYSYCGNFNIKGDIEKEFIGILQYGTGLGPIGVTRGGYFINRYGGAEVTVLDTSRACRNLGYIFDDSSTRYKAMKIIESFFPEICSKMNEILSKWGAEVSFVEILPVEDMGRFYLYVDFTADFKLYRGHGAISKATGLAKKLIDEKLNSEGIQFTLSGITQGYDGDLKPSPRNKRGRYCMAKLSIPDSEIEKLTGKPADKFVSFVAMDAKGTEKLGWFHHTGMGGEIISGVYKALKINPHAPLVSSTQRIFCYREKSNIVYGVEMPNIEAGVISSSEGAIPPLGREIMRFMGITNACEFASFLTTLVLAGELNLSIEIVSENLYRFK